MSPDRPALHMICGKIASGKSTLAQELGQAPRTVVISEDEWLSGLYPEEITSGPDYVRYAARLKSVLGPHVTHLLASGVSVVLDFPANTVEFRRWMKALVEDTDASHVLHVLDLPDEVCLARLKARNKGGEHAYAASEALFRRFTAHFVMPTPEEGLNIRPVTPDVRT